MSKDQALQFHANKAFERLNSAAQVYQRGENALGLMEDAAESVLILRSGIDALTAQRDEGLARESELKAQRDSLANEMFDLQQRLAEAVVLLDRALPLVGEPNYSWMADAGVFVATHGPGCADGEPTK
nr:hypothetical protein [uncultured Pseudomonas sp.]